MEQEGVQVEPGFMMEAQAEMIAEQQQRIVLLEAGFRQSLHEKRQLEVMLEALRLAAEEAAEES